MRSQSFASYLVRSTALLLGCAGLILGTPTWAEEEATSDSVVTELAPETDSKLSDVKALLNHHNVPVESNLPLRLMDDTPKFEVLEQALSQPPASETPTTESAELPPHLNLGLGQSVETEIPVSSAQGSTVANPGAMPDLEQVQAQQQAQREQELLDLLDLNAQDLGTEQVPKREKLEARLERLAANEDLAAEDKERISAALNSALETLPQYENIVRESKRLARELSTSEQTLHDLELELGHANEVYTQAPPAVSDLTLEQSYDLLASLGDAQGAIQDHLNEATAAYSSLQTLPTRAQNQISTNSELLSDITRTLNDSSLKLFMAEREALEFEALTLERHNTLLQAELKTQVIFQDIVNYRISILNLQKDYLSRYITAARLKQNALLSEQYLHSTTLDATGDSSLDPLLSAEIATNNEIADGINHMLETNTTLQRELQEVTVALRTTEQINVSLQEQLSDLQGSSILSRLLNRQQGAIPEVAISFNLDELIPNFNLWLYEIRSFREEIFDIQSYVADMVEKDSRYEPYQEQLSEIVHQRRDLCDELSNIMSDSLTLASELRAQYNAFTELRSQVVTSINDHLFWLASNQGISLDFIKTIYPTALQQVNNLMRFVTNTDNLKQAAFDFIYIVLPLILVAFIFYKARPFFYRRTNELALRLDKSNDSFYLTPLALIFHAFLILPKVMFFTLIGAVVIFWTVDSFEHQVWVTWMLALHLICFLYIRHILEPNSVMQRHFCIPPKVLAHNRMLIDKLWYASIPMLLIANIREVDPTKISDDVIGYLLMMLGFLYLTFFAARTIKQLLAFRSPTLGFTTLAIAGFLTPLTIALMLGLGYYYTIIQLLNRVALTLYLFFLYFTLSQVLRRELYVAQNKITAKMRRLRVQAQAKGTSLTKRFAASGRGAKEARAESSESLGLEFVNQRAFKLFNSILLVVFLYFMYHQWSDLAGVLTYLDQIYLYQDITVVDGKTVSSSLSVGDVLLALFIILVAFVLNRNLPLVIDRLFMLRNSTKSKSASYTTKLITGYAITTIAIILAAGAVGIKWENLQWLVAALSVGLGFGLQEIFGNFVSGIIILFERQLRVGDIVTLNNLSGTVNKIRIRATTIISFDNKEVVIPNKQFITEALTNWSLSNTVTMIEFAVGVAYDADTNRAKDILRSIIRRCPDISREQRPKVYIKSLDASAITIMCEVYVKEIGKRKVVYDFLSTETLRIFKDLGIEIPFDQLDVTIRNLDTNQTLTIHEEKLVKAAALGAKEALANLEASARLESSAQQDASTKHGASASLETTERLTAAPKQSEVLTPSMQPSKVEVPVGTKG